MELLSPDMPSAEAIYPYLKRIKGTYSNFGPLVRELENRLSSIYGMPVCTVSNATLGLELGMQALFPPNARVLVPALTFIATGSAILRAGFRPVIADSGMMLTPEIASKYQCDAILPVCAYGLMNVGWREFEKPVLLDAAAGFGNQPYEVPSVFSLHCTKALGAGEGGFVVGPESFVEKVRGLSNFGRSGPDQYSLSGTNAKMSEYTAAVALAALDQWPQVSEARQIVREMYAKRIPVLAPPIPTIFPVKVDSVRETKARLEGLGIPSRQWYVPLLSEYKIPLGNSSIYGVSDPTPETKKVSDHLLCVPFNTKMTEEDVETVCRNL